MRRFWDQRADEDAFFFVDNRLTYGAPDLDRFWSEGEKTLDALLELVGADIDASDHVVEIGCGVGRLTRAVARRAADVRAIDVSPRMLELAREHNSDLDNVEWLTGDGRGLTGMEDDSADACVSHVVFQHIPDPAITLGYIRDIGRVLRPGGWAAVHVSNDPSIHRPRKGLRHLLGDIGAALRRAPRGQRHPAWLGSAVELAAVETAADASGMDLERVVGEGPQFCYLLMRRRTETDARRRPAGARSTQGKVPQHRRGAS